MTLKERHSYLAGASIAALTILIVALWKTRNEWAPAGRLGTGGFFDICGLFLLVSLLVIQIYNWFKDS